MAEKLPHDDITPFGNTGKTKKEQVADMFDQIAGRYDFMNRCLSAGIDIRWRRKAIRQMGAGNPRVILDMATGTADMAILTCRLLDPDRIIGIDLSAGMLERGMQKVEKEGLTNKIALQQGDSEAINFPDNSFDAVMVAFGVRNFEHLENGLAEMLRVLRPGGQLIVLEFSQPKYAAVRSLYRLYMGVVAPEMARFFSKNRKAYQYLDESARAFPERRQFIDILNRVGYSDTSFKPLSLGICCIYSGRKSGVD